MTHTSEGDLMTRALRLQHEMERKAWSGYDQGIGDKMAIGGVQGLQYKRGAKRSLLELF